VLEQKAAALLQIAGLRREKASEIKTKCGGIFPRVGLQRLTVNSQSASLDIIVDTVEIFQGNARPKVAALRCASIPGKIRCPVAHHVVLVGGSAAAIQIQTAGARVQL
jgi:hypothetical protein